jgi:hypothetical protein
MQVNRNDTVLSCAICERTLLLGEKVAGYLHAGEAMSVCELCVDEADQRGWHRAGAPTPPPTRAAVERGPGLFGRLLGRERDRGRRVVEVLPDRATAIEPPPSREGETLTHEGAALFNESQYARTINGLRRSLGAPRVSVVPISSSRPQVVVTVAWDISWYQYRVDAQKAEIHLEGRGDDPEDLDRRWQDWNAHLASDGRLQVAV